RSGLLPSCSVATSQTPFATFIGASDYKDIPPVARTECTVRSKLNCCRSSSSRYFCFAAPAVPEEPDLCVPGTGLRLGCRVVMGLRRRPGQEPRRLIGTYYAPL